MNRIVKRALWGALLAGGITLAGATAAHAAEAPPHDAGCRCDTVKSTLTTVTNLLSGPCDPSPGAGIGGPASGAAGGGIQVVSPETHGPNEAARALRASSAAEQGSLAQTGYYDPFLLVSGVVLLAAGAAMRFLERR